MSIQFLITDEAFRQVLSPAGEVPRLLERIHAARRDTAAFQVILGADRQYSVNIGQQLWVSPQGALAGRHTYLRLALRAPFSAKLCIEEYVTDDDGLEKADILLSQEVRESRAQLPTVVWAELEIPEAAAAGEYPVEVLLYSSCDGEDEQLVGKQTVTVCVAEACLPKPAEQHFYLDLWQHCSNIARQHEVPMWSDAHFAVLERYTQTLAALGQRSITVLAGEIPWNGQGCREDHAHGGNLYEYSMVKLTRRLDGALIYDYSVMQRYIDLCTSAGFHGDIEVFGLVNVWSKDAPLCPEYPEAICLRYYDEADGCYHFLREYEEICSYVRALEQYFIRTEQIERVRIAADEPADVEKYRKSLELLKQLAPRFRCKTAINHAEFIGEFHDRIDDFSPYLHCVIKEYEALQGYRQIYPEKRFLWYTCCGSAIPNTLMRSHLLECRMIGIFTAFLGLEGYLRWAYTCWPSEVRKDIRYGIFDAGDNHFVYPARNGDVLLSLRYKQLRRGICDFELLEQYRRKNGAEQMKKLLSRVIYVRDIKQIWQEEDRLPAASLFSLCWKDYDEIKAELLRAVAAD